MAPKKELTLQKKLQALAEVPPPPQVRTVVLAGIQNRGQFQLTSTSVLPLK